MLNKGAYTWNCVLSVQARAVRHHPFAEIFQLTKKEGPAHLLTAVHSPTLAGKLSWQLRISARQFSCQNPFCKVLSTNALPQRAANTHRELLKGRRRKLLNRIIAGHRTSGMLTFLLSSPKTGKMPKSKTYSKNWSLSISPYRKQQTSWQKARQASNENTPIIALLVFLWTFIKPNTFKKYFSFD